MKAVLETGFVLTLMSTFLIGLGMITAEQADAKPAPPGPVQNCPSLSDLPGGGDSFVGRCNHPCGGTCNLWSDGATGSYFYDANCPLA